jgi:ketosteroid isomerase-like protein
MRFLMKTVSLVLLVICTVSLFAPGQEGVNSDAASKIIALENAWNTALQLRDMKAVDPLLDNALVFIDLKGRLMRKADVLADVKSSSVQQTVSEGMTAQMHGSVAIVTGVLRTKGVEDGKPFLRRSRYIDTWVSKSGKWVCVASQATPIVH